MIVYDFLFLWCLCLVLVSEWWQPHKVNFEVLPPFRFLEEFEKDKYKFFFVCLELPSETTQAFVCRKFVCVCVFFLITDKILLLVISLIKLSVSSWLSFESLYISKTLAISSRVSNLFAYNWSWYSILFLYFCDISCYFYFFIY